MLKSLNLYPILWLTYYYAMGSAIAQLALLGALLMSVYYFYKVNRMRKLPHFIKALNCFLIVLTIYGLLTILINTPVIIAYKNKDIPVYAYLLKLGISLLPIYGFFFYTRKKVITEQWIRYTVIILLIVFIKSFFENQTALLEKAFDKGSSQEEFTNNVGYSFCALLPLIFFFKNRVLIQYILLFIITIFVLMSIKRGAILITILCVIYFLYKNFTIVSKRQKYIIFSFSVLFLMIGMYLMSEFIASSDYVQLRIEQTIEGNSSGRDDIYSTLFNYYLNQTSFLQFFLGGGAEYTLVVIGYYAHNDWLELLINQGLLGIILYIWYFVALLKDSYLLRKYHYDVSITFSMTIGIMFLLTLFSMSYSALALPTTLTLGYGLGKIYN